MPLWKFFNWFRAFIPPLDDSLRCYQLLFFNMVLLAILTRPLTCRNQSLKAYVSIEKSMKEVANHLLLPGLYQQLIWQDGPKRGLAPCDRKRI